MGKRRDDGNCAYNMWLQCCKTGRSLPTGQISKYATSTSKKESYAYGKCLKPSPKLRRSKCSKSKRVTKEADQTESAHQCSKDCGNEEKPTHKTPPNAGLITIVTFSKKVSTREWILANCPSSLPYRFRKVRIFPFLCGLQKCQEFLLCTPQIPLHTTSIVKPDSFA